MAGILIYKQKLQYYSFITSDDKMYNFVEKSLSKDCDILWKKANTTIEKIEKSRKTKNDIVAKLNKGEKINLKKELDFLFL